MASIPSNGYAEVMAGTNNYSGSNSFDGSCPQTAIPPVVNNDLCNKLYVDNATGGGLIPTLTDKGSLITADGTQAVIFDQNPYQTALSTTTVYDWNSLAIAQSRAFTTTVTTSLILGTSIKITYNGTDEITGTITSIVGTTVTITITALASAVYVAVPQITTAPPPITISGSVPNGSTLAYFPATTTPSTGITPANTIITNGICYIYDALPPSPTFALTLVGTGNIQRATSNTQPPLAYVAPPAPSSVTWTGTNGGCFIADSQAVQIQTTLIPPGRVNFGFPNGAPLTPAYFAGVLEGYQVPYSTGVISIVGNVCLIADPVSTTGLKWGVVSGGGGGGVVNSVSGGNNITISGALATPTVNVSAPLTSILDVGNQTVGSSLGAINITPLAAQDVNVTVSSVGKLHVIQSTVGGSANPLFQLENTEASAAAPHLDYYKNSASPANGDILGALSFHGRNSVNTKREFSRITATAADITNTSENGQISFLTNENATTPTEYFRVNGLTASNEIYKTLETKGQYVQNSLAASNLRLRNTANGGLVDITNTGNSTIQLISSGGSTANITATADRNITLTSGSSTGTITLTPSNNATFGSGGVVITQPVTPAAPSALRTSIVTTQPTQPVVYYPSVHTDNQNANAINIEAPKIPYQTMTLINSGIAPNDVWVNFGVPQPFALNSMYLTNNNAELWVGYVDSGGTAVLSFLDPATLTPLPTPSSIPFTGLSSGTGATRILCFDEDATYIYVGGDFSTVNGNAQAQRGITRINKTTYLEDPMYDSANTNCGVVGFVNTICSLGGSDLFVGGKFSSVAGTGATHNNGIRITGINNASGNQTFDDNGGTIGFDKDVNASVWNGTYAFIGGNFTLVNSTLVVTRNYMIAYNVAANIFEDCDGNSFNNAVWGLGLSVLGSYVLTVGQFTQGGSNGVCYIDAGTPINAFTSANITPSTTISSINRVSCADAKDCFSDQNNHVYISSSSSPPTVVWESLGVSDAVLTQTGVIHNTVTGSGAFVCYSDSLDLKENNPVLQSVTFTLPAAKFRTSTGDFTNAIFPTQNTALQFIADATGTVWIPVGQQVILPCSFT